MIFLFLQCLLFSFCRLSYVETSDTLEGGTTRDQDLLRSINQRALPPSSETCLSKLVLWNGLHCSFTFHVTPWAHLSWSYYSFWLQFGVFNTGWKVHKWSKPLGRLWDKSHLELCKSACWSWCWLHLSSGGHEWTWFLPWGSQASGWIHAPSLSESYCGVNSYLLI